MLYATYISQEIPQEADHFLLIHTTLRTLYKHTNNHCDTTLR
jgi:hypothetical protein